MKSYANPILRAALLTAISASALLNAQSMRATITGGARNGGSCTVQVNVDGAAEVEINGDAGSLRTISGQPAAWQRFQCSAPLPNASVDLWISRVQGRGMIRLVEEPRRHGGRAVIRIEDPQSGRSTYSFDLAWRSQAPGGWPPPPPPGQGRGGFFPAWAIQGCRDAVSDRLYRDGYQYVNFDQVIPNKNPGQNDWVTGLVTGKRGLMTRQFSFSCAVDLASGRVRSVDVRNR